MLLSGSTIILNGALYNYTMHFNTGQLPPVSPSAFWSVTPYNTNGQVIANAINRYSLGSRDSLYINPDGSLDIYLQDAEQMLFTCTAKFGKERLTYVSISKIWCIFAIQ